MNQNNTMRNIYIDAVKGFLMLVVIWSHSRAWVDIGYYLTAGYMGGFFFLMGYTTMHWDRKLSEYIVGKAKRLLIPYIIYGSCLILYYVVNNLIQGTITINSFLLCIGGFIYNAYAFNKSGNTILMVCDNNTFWFITTIFVASIISFSVYKILRGRNRKIQFVTISILVLSTFYFDITLRSYLLPWGIDTAFIGSVLILLGILFRKYENSKYAKGIRNRQVIWILITTIFIAVYLCLVYANPGINMAVKEFGSYGVISLLAFLCISVLETIVLLFVFRTIPQKSFVCRFMAWIGQHGITFMAIQIFTIRRLNSVVSHLTGNQYLVGYISIIGTLICGYILSRVFEKYSHKYWLLSYL